MTKRQTKSKSDSVLNPKIKFEIITLRYKNNYQK